MARDKERREKTYVREGMEAAQRGEPAERCPYHSRFEAREAWLAGHKRGVTARFDTADTPASPTHRHTF